MSKGKKTPLPKTASGKGKLPEGKVSFTRVSEDLVVALVEKKNGEFFTEEEARAFAEAYFARKLQEVLSLEFGIQDTPDGVKPKPGRNRIKKHTFKMKHIPGLKVAVSKVRKAKR